MVSVSHVGCGFSGHQRGELRDLGGVGHQPHTVDVPRFVGRFIVAFASGSCAFEGREQLAGVIPHRQIHSADVGLDAADQPGAAFSLLLANPFIANDDAIRSRGGADLCRPTIPTEAHLWGMGPLRRDDLIDPHQTVYFLQQPAPSQPLPLLLGMVEGLGSVLGVDVFLASDMAVRHLHPQHVLGPLLQHLPDFDIALELIIVRGRCPLSGIRAHWDQSTTDGTNGDHEWGIVERGEREIRNSKFEARNSKHCLIAV